MKRPDWNALRDDLTALHRAALRAADPAPAVRRVLATTRQGLVVDGERIPLPTRGRLWLVAAGKAAHGMARAACSVLGARVSAGVVVAPRALQAEPPHGARWPPALRLLEGSHPLPAVDSLAAGDAVCELLAATAPGDVVLVLLSGGASALLERLRPGVTLEDLRRVTAQLQRAGADVRALNTVRRALSALKGGGLARLAAPARVVTLAISDVVGDMPEAIASGPTVPSPTGPRDALHVLESHGVTARVPQVCAVLAAAAVEPAAETPAGVFRIVASNRSATAALAAAAARRGFRSQVTSGFLQGEAREAGRVIGGCAASVRAYGLPFPPPACLVWGGETTVTVRGEGRGGRNQELALGAAQSLDGVAHAAVFSFATDGIDGASQAAGAVATGETLARAAALGLSVEAALAANDSQRFFRALGDGWETGATGTNVNDLAAALIYP